MELQIDGPADSIQAGLSRLTSLLPAWYPTGQVAAPAAPAPAAAALPAAPVNGRGRGRPKKQTAATTPAAASRVDPAAISKVRRRTAEAFCVAQ